MSEGARYLWYLHPFGSPPIVVGVASEPAPEGTLIKSQDIGNGALAQAGEATSQTAAHLNDLANVTRLLGRLIKRLP